MRLLSQSDALIFSERISTGNFVNDEVTRNILNVIFLWLSDDNEPFEELQESIDILYTYTRQFFPYTGTIYRGITLNELSSFNERDIYVSTSFEMGNALMFTGAIDDYALVPFVLNEDYKNTGYLIKANVENALDLSSLILYLFENVEDVEVASKLESYLYENEVITKLPHEMEMVLITEENLNSLFYGDNLVQSF